MKSNSLVLCSAVVIALAGLSACKPTAPSAATTPASQDKTATKAAAPADKAPAASTDGPHDNLNAVVWMQRSAEYREVTRTIYRAATQQLDAALQAKDRDALVEGERKNSAKGLPPAIILDVDETVLDNSPYQARLIRNGKDFDDLTWDQWVAEKKAKAVPGAVEFTQAAAKKGITVLYVSNRAMHLKDATIANLKALGYPVKDDSVFLGLGTFVKDCEQNGSEKLCRRMHAGQSYRVLMQFGDQLGDFVQVISNAPDARDALAAKYDSWFGERWFMLPNPSYGSWETALFNNAWDQPAETRRKMKRDALDVQN